MDTIQIIINLLSEKGVSAAKMSRDLRFSNALFTQWKQRKQNPSIEKINKMAEYFDVSTDYLLGKTDIKKAPSSIDESALPEDRRELLHRIMRLSPEYQKQAADYLKFLIAQQESKADE